MFLATVRSNRIADLLPIDLKWKVDAAIMHVAPKSEDDSVLLDLDWCTPDSPLLLSLWRLNPNGLFAAQIDLGHSVSYINLLA